jgi:hypothetical protein
MKKLRPPTARCDNEMQWNRAKSRTSPRKGMSGRDGTPVRGDGHPLRPGALHEPRRATNGLTLEARAEGHSPPRLSWHGENANAVWQTI